jgi:glycosyltransferase involved in cell wall biosynthesis
MIHDKKIVVVLPAYQAEKTVEKSFRDIPKDIVDHILMVDDASSDKTVEVGRRLGIKTIVHKKNLGYGGNQKTCYREAISLGADIVVMLHPDYQYEPKLISSMAAMVASEVYDCVLGSRILGNTALRGGMPFYKYVANRFLTALQNLIMGTKLSEFHTGYRAFSRKLLESLALDTNSDDFVFDNQMLVQIIAQGFRIGEISCPTRYFGDSSSISLYRSIIYAFGVLRTTIEYRLWSWKIYRPDIFYGTRSIKRDP